MLMRVAISLIYIVNKKKKKITFASINVLFLHIYCNNDTCFYCNMHFVESYNEFLNFGFFPRSSLQKMNGLNFIGYLVFFILHSYNLPF
jgi:hypothetical protein